MQILQFSKRAGATAHFCNTFLRTKYQFKPLKLSFMFLIPQYCPISVLLGRGWFCSSKNASISPVGTSWNKTIWEDSLFINTILNQHWCMEKHLILTNLQKELTYLSKTFLSPFFHPLAHTNPIKKIAML